MILSVRSALIGIDKITMQTALSLFPLIPMLNWVMSAVKMFAGNAMSTTWLRVVLLGLAILGSISISALSGNPLDFAQVSDWGKLLVEALGLSLASHASFKVITV